MTTKAAKGETDALTATATTEPRELTANELATIHGGWSLDFLTAPSSNTGTTQDRKSVV